MKDLDPRGLPWPDVDVFGRGNSGIDYIHRFEGAAPGPHVMITAIVHGNEVTGAIGLDWLLRQEPDVLVVGLGTSWWQWQRAMWCCMQTSSFIDPYFCPRSRHPLYLRVLL